MLSANNHKSTKLRSVKCSKTPAAGHVWTQQRLHVDRCEKKNQRRKKLNVINSNRKNDVNVSVRIYKCVIHFFECTFVIFSRAKIESKKVSLRSAKFSVQLKVGKEDFGLPFYVTHFEDKSNFALFLVKSIRGKHVKLKCVQFCVIYWDD